MPLVRYDPPTSPMPVAVSGAMPPGSVPDFDRVWGRGVNDVYAAGTDLAHYDGTTWSVVADEPPSAHVPANASHDNTFVTGDATAVWIVTPGPRFFRKVDAPRP
jgi:hypothetical protein